MVLISVSSRSNPVGAKTISSPISQLEGSSKVRLVAPTSAVSARRVHDTARGDPWRSSPPNTPGININNVNIYNTWHIQVIIYKVDLGRELTNATASMTQRVGLQEVSHPES